jgi:hypothetical protein
MQTLDCVGGALDNGFVAHGQVIKELEKKAQIYSVYFTTLSPVMMTEGMGGNYHDMEKSLHQRISQVRNLQP